MAPYELFHRPIIQTCVALIGFSELPKLAPSRSGSIQRTQSIGTIRRLKDIKGRFDEVIEP